MQPNSVATKHRLRFWLAFVFLYVATLFIPIFPIYDSAAIYRPSHVIQAVLPVWAVYYRAYYLIDPAFLLWPIVISHCLLCYWLACGTSGNVTLPTQYSLLMMLFAMSGFAIFLACVSAYGAIGFSVLFVGGLFGLILANLFRVANIFGLRLDVLNRSGLILSIVLCLVLATSGVTIFFGYPDNGWIHP